MSPTTIIAVANQKGGVAKTTTTVHLASFFAGQGYKTLVVDLDPQGHAASALGLPKGNGLLRLLVEKRPLTEAITPARPNLDVIANDHTAELVKERVMRSNFREFQLDTALRAASDYELIFLDTPPSTDVLHVTALVASDYVLIPAIMDFLALDGVGGILTAIRELGAFPNVQPPALLGILPTLFDRTTNETLENIRRLQQSLGAEQILPPIPRDTKVREAASFGQTLWEYAPTSAATIGYTNGAKSRNSQGKTGGYLHLAEIIAALIGR